MVGYSSDKTQFMSYLPVHYPILEIDVSWRFVSYPQIEMTHSFYAVFSNRLDFHCHSQVWILLPNVVINCLKLTLWNPGSICFWCLLFSYFLGSSDFDSSILGRWNCILNRILGMFGSNLSAKLRPWTCLGPIRCFSDFGQNYQKFLRIVPREL